MKAARFVSKLENNIERNYSTRVGINKLLSSANVTAIGNHTREGPGVYFDVFEEDMAVARTVVSVVHDYDTRPFSNLDAVVLKFDGDDKQLILNLLKGYYSEKLAANQNNGGQLSNPIAEVEI